MKRVVSAVTLLLLALLPLTELLAQVAITSFNPLTGQPGTTVTLTGTNFSTTPSNNIVYFGNVRAAVTAATATTLTVTAPYGATHHPITVTTGGYTAYSRTAFLLTFPGIGSAFMPHSFTPVLSKTTRNYPGCVVAGDVDGDGRPDLVVTNWNSATLSIYRNTGFTDNISFADKVDFTTPGGPESVTLGDLDGDGKLDLAVANFDANSVSVFKNNSVPGSLVLSPRTDYPSATHPMSVCIDDLNLDGKPDIAVANQQADSINIYVNTTSSGISFATRISVPGNSPSGLTTGDLNNDGKPELIAVSFSYDPVYVYRNTSTGGNISFAQQVGFWSNSSPLGSCLADLNADGRPDIAVANFNANTATFFRNLSSTGGPISFTTKVEANAGGGTRKAAAGDLDGDGKADIVVVNQTTNNFSPFPNRATVSTSQLYWQEFVTGMGPSWVAVSDLDSNGRPEVIIPNSNSNTLTIYKNAVGEAHVQPSGTNPVSGPMTNKMKVDPSVQTYNGHPYVQRHYDVEPVNNPATATATVTLYFTQEDFDNFNAFPGHGLDLPQNPPDNANKANLRIYQHHGFSATSQPGTYSGPAVEINPDDNRIVWNYTTLLWEVSFEVIGFSGFFVSSLSSPVLPLTLLSFTASPQERHAVIRWITAEEQHVDYFELRRSTDGRAFLPLARVDARGTQGTQHIYQYQDTLGGSSTYYYQLKMVDTDGSFRLSPVVRIKPGAPASPLSFYPNPAKDILIVSHPSTVQPSELRLVDLYGRAVKKQVVPGGVSETRMHLAGLPPAGYYLIWSNGVVEKKELLIIR